MPTGGRIIAAVGYSGAQVDPSCIDILFNDVPVVQGGSRYGAPSVRPEATAVLKQAEFSVKINLGLGEARAEYYTSDLTYEYIKINGRLSDLIFVFGIFSLFRFCPGHLGAVQSVPAWPFLFNLDFS